MNLSSNSLFHFTSRLDTLSLILAGGFYGSFCKEVLHYKKEAFTLIVLMISFCDIPLKTISLHTKYGKYGIGLNKDWGIEHQLNPVLYLEKNSALADSLIRSLYTSRSITAIINPQLKQIRNKIGEITNNKNYNPVQKNTKLEELQDELRQYDDLANNMRHIIHSIFYTKHYSDALERNGEIINDHRFYDEREWRFLPEFQSLISSLHISERQYKEWRGDIRKPKPILTNVNLPFRLTDIEYIIVEKKDEIKVIRDIIPIRL